MRTARRLRPLVLICLPLLPSLARAQGCTITVNTASQLFNVLTNPALPGGSTICVQPGTYDFPADIPISQAPSSPITLRGVRDAQGRAPVLQGTTTNFANGLLFFTNTARDWIVEDLVIRGAKNPNVISYQGPAGAFIQGQRITLRRCELTDNGLGVRSLEDADEILLEACDIHRNLRHNVSMLCRSVIVRGCKIHHSAARSINYKERCQVSLLEGNWIAHPGTNGYDVDFAGSWFDPQLGTVTDSHALMIGNVVIHDTAGATPTVINIGDGANNDTERRGHIALVNNTFVVDNGDPALFRRFWDTSTMTQKTATAILTLHNNIAHHLGPQPSWQYLLFDSIAPAAAWTSYPVAGSNNWFFADYAPVAAALAPALTGTLFGTDPGFVNPSALRFGLRTQTPASPCLDAGNATPTYTCEVPMKQRMAIAHLEYDPITDLALLPRRTDGSIDLGAFEAEGSAYTDGDLSVGGSTSLGLNPNLCAGPHRLAAAVPRSGPHLLLVSDRTLAAPLSVPGVGGSFLLDLTSPLAFPLFQGADVPSGLLEASFTAPPLSSLVGFTVYFQSLNCDLGNPTPCRFSRDVAALTFSS